MASARSAGSSPNPQADVEELLRNGRALGVHVVASMLRSTDVRKALRATIGTILELRLNAPTDSVIAAAQASMILDQPGRVLTDRALFAQAALPRVDGIRSADGVKKAIERTAAAARAAWPHVPSDPLSPAILPDFPEIPGRVPIGRDVETSSVVHLDLFGRDGDLLVFGDERCGKTNLLRLIADGLTQRFSPDELFFVVLAPRGGLSDVVPEPYLNGYAGTSHACAALTARVARILGAQMPVSAIGEDARRWLTGSRVVVLVDDYEVLTSGDFAPLLPYIGSGEEIGLHFVVARHIAGAADGLDADPFLAALRENGATALVMGGDRKEGPVLEPGVYASEQPAGHGRWVRQEEPARLIQTALADEIPVSRGNDLPDPALIHTRRGFANALTRVREVNGLTIRDVATAADLPHSIVGDYYAGRHLPPLRDDRLPSILRACRVSDPEEIAGWLEALRRVRRQPGP